MKLFHYSKEKYDSLKTLAMRGLDREGFKSDPKDPYAYNKSMSFFFEPIPLHLPKILKNRHEFWVAGSQLYQYTVDLASLDPDLGFQIVESNATRDLLFFEQDWGKVKEDPSLRQVYLKQYEDLVKKLGYTGKGSGVLEKVLKTLPYDYEKDYALMVKLDEKDPENDLMNRYAACVPHVMVFLSNRNPVIPEHVELITLTNSKSVFRR